MATARVSRYVAATLAASALLVGAGATVASADVHPTVTTYEPTGGYQFESVYNLTSGRVRRVSDVRLIRQDSRQTLGPNGVTLSVDPATGQYAAASVIVPVGTVGGLFDGDMKLRDLDIVGPDTAAVRWDLLLDTNRDDHYLAWSNRGVYLRHAGDRVLRNVHAGVTDRSQLGVDATDSTRVWLRVRVSSNSVPRTATVASVHGKTLVETVLGPSVLTLHNVCRLAPQTTRNEWVVRNAAGDRDRTFHLGVTYQGRTAWTGLHTVAAGGSRVVITPFGGRATLRYFDGYGHKKIVHAYSDHTEYCG